MFPFTVMFHGRANPVYLKDLKWQFLIELQLKKNEFFSLKLSLNSNVSAKLHLVKLICKLKLKIEL